MDIDEFLDRELSDLDLQTGKTEEHEPIELPEFKGQIEPSPLFENLKANLSKGNLEQAEQSYIQLWHILMQQKLKWNKELYEELLILTKQFSTTLNYAYTEMKKKVEHINGLINRAKVSLREGKKELPFKIYSEVEGINNSIPNVFFEEKRIIEEQIITFYKELRNTTDNDLIKRVLALIREINQLIDKINTSIRANDMINAIVSYNKCIEFYNQVPEGFLRYKNSIGMRLLDIYKILSIYTEISNLQKQLVHHSIQQAPQRMQTKSILLNEKRESARKNIQKGFYDEASRDIEEALKLEPNDAEARVMHAKIKTLQ